MQDLQVRYINFARLIESNANPYHFSKAEWIVHIGGILMTFAALNTLAYKVSVSYNVGAQRRLISDLCHSYWL